MKLAYVRSLYTERLCIFPCHTLGLISKLSKVVFRTFYSPGPETSGDRALGRDVMVVPRCRVL